MSEHRINLQWKRNNSDFTYEKYDRTHQVMFQGGETMSLSSAPQYLGKEQYPNPEELLAASLSSCHMLTFLAIAAKSRYVVDSYEDEAVATLGKNEQGEMAVVQITLRPKVVFSGDNRPTPEKIQQMHEKSGKFCFIESSLKSRVIVEPQML